MPTKPTHYIYIQSESWRTIEFRSNRSSSPHSTVSHQAHGRRIFAHWTQHWNTAGQTEEETQAIAAWRATLLHGALGNPESFLQRTLDQEAEMQALLRRLGLAE
jgi:hypothetical protein